MNVDGCCCKQRLLFEGICYINLFHACIVVHDVLTSSHYHFSFISLLIVSKLHVFRFTNQGTCIVPQITSLLELFLARMVDDGLCTCVGLLAFQ
jgi:hypothetical protein